MSLASPQGTPPQQVMRTRSGQSDGPHGHPTAQRSQTNAAGPRPLPPRAWALRGGAHSYVSHFGDEDAHIGCRRSTHKYSTITRATAVPTAQDCALGYAFAIPTKIPEHKLIRSIQPLTLAWFTPGWTSRRYSRL